MASKSISAGFSSNFGPNPRRAIAALRRRLVKAAEQAVEESCVATVAKAKENITKLGSVDRGALRGSIDYALKTSRDRISGVVFVGAPYGAWVEFGRKGLKTNYAAVLRNGDKAASAAWPNVGAIQDWVRRNYRKLAPAGRTRSGRARKPGNSQVKSVAFLISRKIAMKGIRPSPFLVPAWKSIRPFFAKRLVTILRQVP